jgi:hypothetical protein
MRGGEEQRVPGPRDVRTCTWVCAQSRASAVAVAITVCGLHGLGELVPRGQHHSLKCTKSLSLSNLIMRDGFTCLPLPGNLPQLEVSSLAAFTLPLVPCIGTSKVCYLW